LVQKRLSEALQCTWKRTGSSPDLNTVINSNELLSALLAALTPAPTCAPGKIDFDGSTAFAPIINEVATEYEQDCPQAQITVSAIGSAEGLTVLRHGNNETPVVAMLDGQPQGLPSPEYVGQPVGVIIFALVGNRDSLPSKLFAAGNGGGLSTAQIAEAFEHRDVSGIAVRPVGRTRGSGTRNDFIHDVLGRQYPSSGVCPQPHGVCYEATTLELLTYVNNTKNAIGYAEADALPFFPSVAAIPIRVHGVGYEPTRPNALNGDYSFSATEYLYTRGIPDGQESDVIKFLMSKPVAAQLRDTSFISCSDLRGSKLSVECPAS
jgi:phosphate transport system substrate-binding protein